MQMERKGRMCVCVCVCVYVCVCVKEREGVREGEKLFDSYNLDSCLKIRANIYRIYAKHSTQHLTLSILLNSHNFFRQYYHGPYFIYENSKAWVNEIIC